MSLYFSKFISKFEKWLIFALIVLVYFADLSSVPFNGDESHWIAFSNRFELFVRGAWRHPAWQPEWPNLHNPTFTYYVIGFSRRLGGFGANDLNGAYEYRDTFDENKAAGNIPSDELLWWSRTGVTSMAVLGVWLMFVLLRAQANRLIAYGWLAVALLDTYFLTFLRRAMNEGVLFGLVMLAVFCLFQVFKVWNGKGRRSTLLLLAWSALAGVFAGLAGQTKLNGLAVGLGLCLGLLLAALRQGLNQREQILKLGLSSVCVVAFMAFAFVASNPVLHRDPLATTVKMLSIRASVMAEQAERVVLPGARLVTLREKLNIFHLVLEKYAPLSIFHLNYLFFGVGLGVVWFVVRGWLRRKHELSAPVAILSVGLVSSLPAFLSLMDWERYFLLPVLFGTVISLYGLDFLARLVWRELQSKSAQIEMGR